MTQYPYHLHKPTKMPRKYLQGEGASHRLSAHSGKWDKRELVAVRTFTNTV